MNLRMEDFQIPKMYGKTKDCMFGVLSIRRTEITVVNRQGNNSDAVVSLLSFI